MPAHVVKVSFSRGFDCSVRTRHAEVRAKVLRVDALAGKLSLTLRPSAVDGVEVGDGDAAAGGASDEEADLDEEMAARLDDEVQLAASEAAVLRQQHPRHAGMCLRAVAGSRWRAGSVHVLCMGGLAVQRG
jgi:hypothetical protein